ncbi:MAG TPA: large conductance mechanosensitive channel protein MscL [Thermoanaerobaculia bacterium]|jgi:large conductance mechanosensitive channel|nr:large conductance mechanosensitive channel protein MscL [Thermoanaerobaculia bacterium]
MIKEFRSFLTKTNALALAVGVIIGAAVGKVVTELASGILMPLIGLLLPTGNWRQARIVLKEAAGKTAESAILYGQFIGAVVDFLVIALVVFLIVKALVKPAPPEPMKECPECLEKVPAAARRCRACTSALS